MARLLCKTVLSRHSLSSALLGGPTSLLRATRACSTMPGEPQLIEVDLDSTLSSSPDGSESEALLIRKLDDVVHRIIVLKSTPDWLPFVPGSSFWVPPRPNPATFVDVVGSLANQLSDEETLALATGRGWPCFRFFVDDGEAAETGEVHTKADKVVRMEIEVKVLDNSQIRSRFEDEE